MSNEIPDYTYGDNIRPDLLRMIPSDGIVIASIGCGTGISEAELVKQNREVHGVDISEQAIALAKTRLTSARVVSPGERMMFDLSSLDGLILADVLEHIPMAGEALRQFASMVKPGGWVVISVPNMRHWSVVLRFVILGDWPERTSGIFDATHLQMMSKKRLERWCCNAGLKIERWFDRYDPVKPRGTLGRILDLMTLRLLHQLFQFQLQCVCRVMRESR